MRIYHKLAFLVAAIGLCTGLALSIVVSNVMDEENEREVLARGTVITRAMANVSLQLIIKHDVIEADKLLRRTMKENVDLDYAYIVDFDGKVFAHSFTKGFPEALAGLTFAKVGAAGMSYSPEFGH